jgi:hypothetical protein
MAEDGPDEPPDLFGDDAPEDDTPTDGDGDGLSTPDPDGDDSAAPLDDLAREVRSRRSASDSEATESDTDALDDPFEPVEVDEVDDEAVWESFAEGETEPEAQVGVGAEAERATEPDEHVVPKRSFCQRCPHFTAPPEMACTHEGTTIVEAVDTDRFLVRNCPVVDDDDVARFD